MAYNRVESQFTSASNYANAATAKADTFIAGLSSVVASLAAPNLDVDLQWPLAPTPLPPVALTLTAPATPFPSDDTGAAPSAPSVDTTYSSPPTEPTYQNFSYTPGTMPSPPLAPADVSSITLPATPEAWTLPTAPTLISFGVRAFGGVKDYSDWANALAVPSELVLAAPTGFIKPDLARYGSALLDSLTANIRSRLDGGTGLDPAIEALIWDRGRDRESITAANAMAEVTRNAEARGFSLPTGAMHAQLREAQRNMYAKSSEISRDVMVKQAELAQANAKHAIEQGIALEGQLIDYVSQVEQRTFDAAKYVAQNAVDIYNTLVDAYKANLERYSTAVATFRGLIDAERAKVEAYTAEVNAERAKVEANQAVVDQYRALIEARTAADCARILVLGELMGLSTHGVGRIESYGERVKAYATEVNTETVRAEVYKAQIQGNQALADIFRTSVEAYSAGLRAKGDLARATADVYDAKARGYASRVQAYTARVNAAGEQARTEIASAGLQVEVAKAQVEQNTSQNQLAIEGYRAHISLYEANKSIAFQKAKVLSDNYFTLKSIVADASKVAAQVNAQLAASAYGTIRASASVSGADSTNTQFNYSGRTSDSKAAPNYT